MKKHLGFTLIELMVVIAIIAILSTAGLAAYTGYIKRAVDVKTRALLEELYGATLAFKWNNNGRLPTWAELVSQMWTSLIYPAKGRSDCIGSEDGINYSYIHECKIVYYRFSDGKFAFSGGILSKNTLKNFHRGDNLDGSTSYTYGIFVGDSPVIDSPEIYLIGPNPSALGTYNASHTPDISFMSATSIPSL